VQKEKKFTITFDKNLQIGFTKPIPLHIEKYYSNNYWVSNNLLGNIKKFIFFIFQKRRINWIVKYVSKGKILDIGSGEANYYEGLSKKYLVTNIEPTKSKVINPSVLKLNFLKWNTKNKFDCICFWESLEHTSNPVRYINKAYKLLNKDGYIFIEYPRFNCFESKLFNKYWFHQDLPRHLSHLTDKGLELILKTSGFNEIKFDKVFSFEYAPWGFMASILNYFKINLTDNLKVNGNLIIFILLTPLFFLSIIIEIVLYIFNESPIGMISAKKL
jgi:SAM-dependent methyltransferase